MPASRWAGLALFVLAAAVAVVYAIYPLIATYDALYALVWGREFWDGQALSFEAYRAPTEHPLSLAVGIVLAPLGFEAARLMTIVILIAFVGLAAGVYRLGRVAFSPLVGLVAAALVVGLYEFFFYAIRAYVDVPFLAFVIWAAALEAERPRRGGIVWVLLGLAGLLRPEAWLLIGLYWLWLAKDAGWTERLRMAAYAAVAPLLWIAVDFVVTGQPLFSLTHTGDYVASLNRDKPLPELPETVVSLLTSLLSRPWLLAAAIGVPLGFWLVRRRAIMPAALLGDRHRDVPDHRRARLCGDPALPPAPGGRRDDLRRAADRRLDAAVRPARPAPRLDRGGCRAGRPRSGVDGALRRPRRAARGPGLPCGRHECARADPR